MRQFRSTRSNHKNCVDFCFMKIRGTKCPWQINGEWSRIFWGPLEVDKLGIKDNYGPYRVEIRLFIQHNSLRVRKVCFLCNRIVKKCFWKWNFEIKLLFGASEMIEVIDNIALPIRRVKQHLVFGNSKINLHNFLCGSFFCKPVL